MDDWIARAVDASREELKRRQPDEYRRMVAGEPMMMSWEPGVGAVLKPVDDLYPDPRNTHS